MIDATLIVAELEFKVSSDPQGWTDATAVLPWTRWRVPMGLSEPAPNSVPPFLLPFHSSSYPSFHASFSKSPEISPRSTALPQHYLSPESLSLIYVYIIYMMHLDRQFLPFLGPDSLEGRG